MDSLLNDIGLGGGVSIRDFIFGGPWWRTIDKKVNPGDYDQWSSMSSQNKDIFITQVLIESTTQVLLSQSNTVEYGLKLAISQVETDESWEKWREKIPVYIEHLKKAETEIIAARSIINEGKSHGYETVKPRIELANFQFIDLNTVAEFINPSYFPNETKDETADSDESLIHGAGEFIKQNPALVIGVVGVIGVGIIIATSRDKKRVLVAQNPPTKVSVQGLNNR